MSECVLTLCSHFSSRARGTPESQLSQHSQLKPEEIAHPVPFARDAAIDNSDAAPLTAEPLFPNNTESTLVRVTRVATAAAVIRCTTIVPREVTYDPGVVSDVKFVVRQPLIGTPPESVTLLGGDLPSGVGVYVSEQPTVRTDIDLLAFFRQTETQGVQELTFTARLDSANRAIIGNQAVELSEIAQEMSKTKVH